MKQVNNHNAKHFLTLNEILISSYKTINSNLITLCYSIYFQFSIFTKSIKLTSLSFPPPHIGGVSYS